MKIKWLNRTTSENLNGAIQRGLLRDKGIKTILIFQADKINMGMLTQNKCVAQAQVVSDNLNEDTQEIKVRVLSAIENMLTQDKRVFMLVVNNEDTGILLHKLLVQKYDRVIVDDVA
jgi:hypothetical protein